MECEVNGLKLSCIMEYMQSYHMMGPIQSYVVYTVSMHQGVYTVIFHRIYTIIMCHRVYSYESWCLYSYHVSLSLVCLSWGQ